MDVDDDPDDSSDEADVDPDNADEDIAPPACPWCEPADDACEHVLGVGHGDPMDALDFLASLSEIEELVTSIRRYTMDGPATLAALRGNPAWWWLADPADDAGTIVGPAVFAARFGLACTHLDPEDGRPSVTVLFSREPEAAAARIEAALKRVVYELRLLSRRLGLDAP